jgi:hypothetical protein
MKQSMLYEAHVDALSNMLSDWVDRGSIWDSIADCSSRDVLMAFDEKGLVCRMMATAALAVLEAALAASEATQERIEEEGSEDQGRERTPLVKRLPPLKGE